MTFKGVLQCGRSDGREECRHGRQVQKVGRAVLLRKSDRRDTCTQMCLGWLR